MKVLKVVAEGITTSFRYPHFMVQVHPTFEMPPPATIYGHIASALGEWFDPTGVKFAYHFTHSGQAVDKEHIIVAVPSSGTLKGTQIPKVLEGNINPFERHLLFQPKLVLYINRPEWESYFRSPRYAVVLGRSQDLFTYVSVETISLKKENYAYFEHTLLPHSISHYTSRGYAITMPRFIDYQEKRRPAFAQYFIIKEKIDSREDFLWFDKQPSGEYWVDPTSPQVNGAQRGLAFLSFVGDLDETINVA